VTARELVDQLAGRGVKLSADGDHLVVRAPKGVLTDEDRAALSSSKAALLVELGDEELRLGPAAPAAKAAPAAAPTATAAAPAKRPRATPRIVSGKPPAAPRAPRTPPVTTAPGLPADPQSRRPIRIQPRNSGPSLWDRIFYGGVDDG
jgi:hypothetical protein